MNQMIFEALGASEVWDKITDGLLALMFVVLAAFALMGLQQWIKRKNLFKVDRELLIMIPVLAVMSVIYFVFDKLWIVTTCPIDATKPSFPSSHVMVATTILMLIMMALPKYVKNRRVRMMFDVMACVVIMLMAFGRVASGMHWFTDVLFGLAFGVMLGLVYKLIIRRKKDE